MDIRLLNDLGKNGEALLLIPDRKDFSLFDSGCALLESIQLQEKLFAVFEYPENGTELRAFARDLYSSLSDMNIRWAYVVGVGEGSCVAQALAIEVNKFVRRLALLNPMTRLKPSILSSWIDSIESRIPCGLPARKLGDDFDSRAEIHRVHCPTLVLTSSDIDTFDATQANFLAERIPNSWKGEISASASDANSLYSGLFNEVQKFSEVRAKYPQKNLNSNSQVRF